VSTGARRAATPFADLRADFDAIVGSVVYLSFARVSPASAGG
jgi:hypothetical protein